MVSLRGTPLADRLGQRGSRGEGGSGDRVVQKWTHDGKTMLLQIGGKGVCDNAGEKCGEPGANKSPRLLNEPADGDIYVAEGYGDHRVVVFDARGKFLRQWGRGPRPAVAIAPTPPHRAPATKSR